MLASYAAGRILVPVVLRLMIAGGLSRRTVSARLVAAHHRLQHGSGMLMAAPGAFLVTLFDGFAGTDLL